VALDGRCDGGADGVTLEHLALDSAFPLLGGEAEELVRSGVHAGAVDVEDLALGKQHREDGVGADQRPGGGSAERLPAAGKHRRARGILEGEAGDDVVEERIGKEAEAVEVDDDVKRGSGLVDDVEQHDGDT
jgi:hypothetical protein